MRPPNELDEFRRGQSVFIKMEHDDFVLWKIDSVISRRNGYIHLHISELIFNKRTIKISNELFSLKMTLFAHPERGFSFEPKKVSAL